MTSHNGMHGLIKMIDDKKDGFRGHGWRRC